ncbi:MAG TPA: phospholipid carrier-dependent glycosyltransferase, partial [Actinomycetota bacterium]|nr:phospholipid carrier-dependent glycosyltransferase [Actinomycetota bacterium]
AYVRNAAFVVTNERDLLHVDRDGEVQPLDFGAHSVAAGPDEVWVSFPERGELQSFAPEGVRQRTAELSIDPGEVIAAERGDRVLVADEAGTRIQSVNPQTARLADRADLDRGADMFAVVDRAGLPWAADGVRLNLIEPRGLAVLGGVELPGFPTALAPVPGQRSVAAVVPGTGIVCATASPEFAWRFGSAVTGSLMVALVFLLAVRLFGSVRAGLLAAVFLTVCGLAFTMSRLAMNDSYVTAGILGAWFCVLGMLYRWGSDEERSRPAALAWLAGAGVLMGAAVASKWPAMFALGGIGLLLIWDLASRRREGVWSLAGPLPVSLAVLGVALLLVPAGIYLASYIPELRMGRTLPGLLQLQRDMFGYHSRLTESHPFGSPWYGWPFGHRAVYLFLGDEGGGRRAEMWTAANPVVFIGGLLALIALAGSAFRRRAVGAAVVVGAALVQYLPWVGVDRVVFLYHYLPVIPFLALALGWWLTDGPAGRPRRTETILAVGGALLSFLLLLPVLTGITLPNAAVDAVKAWLPWVF